MFKLVVEFTTPQDGTESAEILRHLLDIATAVEALKSPITDTQGDVLKDARGRVVGKWELK